MVFLNFLIKIFIFVKIMKIKYYFLCFCVVNLAFNARSHESSALFPRKHSFPLFSMSGQKTLKEKILMNKQTNEEKEFNEDNQTQTLAVREI